MEAANNQSLINAFNQGKYTNKTQENIIFLELFKSPANTKMLHVKTGIPREAICRRKRDLEDAGLLYQIGKDYCPYTGRLVQLLTTNPQTYQRWREATQK